MVVIVCLHASTMFYCTAPGLAMWVLDWGMRLYELREELKGGIEAVGRGWYMFVLLSLSSSLSLLHFIHSKLPPLFSSPLKRKHIY